MTDTEQQQQAYRPHTFESHWLREWEREGLYRAENNSESPKFYLLEFFPYPSGAGLSVGHSKNYVPMDALSRFKRMSGFNVLHPMGWDAFGLPAENEAIVQQIHPQENTAVNVATYKRQMNLQGLSYDWSREIDASQPEYYRWTQWFFLLMMKRGLAYRQMNAQWWCPKCQTILANEQVQNGYCWRHGDQLVERKNLEQWYFRITDYADELLTSLGGLDWPEPILAMQKNWIGRSEGARIEFKAKAVDGSDITIPVFTTRPDTIFGATFMVLSPEHPEVERLTTAEHHGRVTQYQQKASRETEIARLSTDREKTGVNTGAFAVNPFTDELMPIWIADYVLSTYGTGAIMAVPGHDERDFEFANKYHLPVRQVISETLGIDVDREGYEAPVVYTGEGYMVDSGEFTGLATNDGRRRVIERLQEMGTGEASISYRMRDWLVSRQRYWGAPIPIVYCDACGIVPVPEDQLPVLLPRLEHYEPAGDGRSPLAAVPEFVNTTCPRCGGPAKRETDTLDTFVDSSWYYLRYCSPHDDARAFDGSAVDYWCPIDLYVGGAEHAVMHLLYFRFLTKVLNDAGLIAFREPAPRLRNQGQMHAPDGFRMSKSRRNVTTPDSVVEKYSADALRAYLLFMGPFDADAMWDETGINGVWRWLHRVWELAGPDQSVRSSVPKQGSSEVNRAVHKTIQKVGNDLEHFRFNTAVSSLMELTNLLQRERAGLDGSEWTRYVDTLLKLMAPLTPFMTEELWRRRGHDTSIHRESWPEFDPGLIQEAKVKIVVQVNGKVRDTLQVAQGSDQSTVETIARESPHVTRWIEGKAVRSVIFVPDRLINLVV